VLDTNSLLKDCQKLLLDTKPGGYLWKQNKKKKREMEKKGMIFATQMGLAIILKKLGSGSAQYYGFKSNCLRPQPRMFLFVCLVGFII